MEQLRTDALLNTQRLHPAELTELTGYVNHFLEPGEYGGPMQIETLQFDPSQDEFMFILSNSTHCLGAECIRYPDALERVRDYLGEDFYVIPLSIHETLIMRKSSHMPLAYLKESVCEVNQLHVEKEERLSDHVYEFNKGATELKIAGEAREKKQEMER